MRAYQSRANPSLIRLQMRVSVGLLWCVLECLSILVRTVCASFRCARSRVAECEVWRVREVTREGSIVSVVVICGGVNVSESMLV